MVTPVAQSPGAFAPNGAPADSIYTAPVLPAIETQPMPTEPPPTPGASARVRAAIAGDRDAAQALLRGLLPRVRNLVRYLIRGDADVDDIAQDALVAVFRGLPSYRADGPLEAWVDRVVARVTFAALRDRRRDAAREAQAAPDLELVSDATAASPDDYLARRQAIRRLDELPYDQRHALVLHHVVEMSVPEIAAALGVPAETVKSRLRLGKARLLRTDPAAGPAPAEEA
jgi:RNA polymerase sigma-70 factor (ECF subfamily)